MRHRHHIIFNFYCAITPLTGSLLLSAFYGVFFYEFDDCEPKQGFFLILVRFDLVLVPNAVPFNFISHLILTRHKQREQNCVIHAIVSLIKIYLDQQNM